MTATSPATLPSASSQEALHALLREVLPRQGAWNDEEYLWLTDRARRLIEFTDSRVEVLPMPTDTHQVILLSLYRLLHAHVRESTRRGGVVTSGLRMRVCEGKFREPDLLLLRDRSDPRRQDRFWLGADLVAEDAAGRQDERDPRDRELAATGMLTRPSRSRRRTNRIRGTGPGRYYGSSSSSRSLKTVRWFRTVRRR